MADYSILKPYDEDRRESERRDPDNERREHGNGSWQIQGKGFRLTALLAALTAVGGGTAYVKSKEQPDLTGQLIMLDARVGHVEERYKAIDSKLQYLVEAEAKRQGREEAEKGRRIR